MPATCRAIREVGGLHVPSFFYLLKGGLERMTSKATCYGDKSTERWAKNPESKPCLSLSSYVMSGKSLSSSELTYSFVKCSIYILKSQWGCENSLR